MKRSGTYRWLVAILLMIAVGGCSNKRQMPSLRETYSKDDDDPFGTSVAYKLSEQLFSRNEVKVKKANYVASLNSNSDTGACMITVTRSLRLSDDELDALLSFVEKGNTAFLASEYFDSALLARLELPEMKPVAVLSDIDALNQTKVKLNTIYYNDSNEYSYFYLPLHHAFDTSGGEAFMQILGHNELGHPNFMSVYYGKGRLLLHCEPRSFSNYFLLQKNNARYFQQAMAFIPATPEHVFWDDYHNSHYASKGKKTNSGLGMLLEYPAMAWAFWIALLLLALYLLFGSKRRQRIVPPIAPNINNTIAFTETVSRLYLQQKDNRNIAEKIITYFMEHVRNTYFLNTAALNDDFVETLGRKSGMPIEETKRLIHLIQKIQSSHHPIPDEQLLSLNVQVEKFYKNKS